MKAPLWAGARCSQMANQIIVAYALDGTFLGSEDGMARIIAPGDKSGARNVTKIARIRVLDPR